MHLSRSNGGLKLDQGLPETTVEVGYILEPSCRAWPLISAKLLFVTGYPILPNLGCFSFRQFSPPPLVVHSTASVRLPMAGVGLFNALRKSIW